MPPTPEVPPQVVFYNETLKALREDLLASRRLHRELIDVLRDMRDQREATINNGDMITALRELRLEVGQLRSEVAQVRDELASARERRGAPDRPTKKPAREAAEATERRKTLRRAG